MNKNWAVAGVSAIVVATGMSVAPAYADHYMAGDMHNHTTCNDGNWSIQTMVTASLGTFGLDWMGDVGHGGAYVRDCRFDDFEGDGPKSGQGAYFENTVGLGAFKGDVVTSTSNSGSPATPHRAMWEWQIIQDYHYPNTIQVAKSLGKTVVFKGTEWNTPGHEHTDTTTLFGQTPFKKNIGNAVAAAEFEYRFDRTDGDTSGGAPDHAWTGKDNTNNSGTNGHAIKSASALTWMQSQYPLGSIALPTHLERAGVFNPAGNGGWNVEHLRDWNNTAPQVAFGMESMPGHQAASSRGEYRAGFCGTGCDSVGVTTYGGTGIYAAKIGGVWDAMLGEGRNFFTFASSDFHQRGIYKATDHMSTADFFPGEYQKTYVPSKTSAIRPQFVLDGLRSGNAYYTQGDLVGSDMSFTANVVGKADNAAKTMGQTLVVKKGQDVVVTLTVTDPAGTNNSPYSFPNPSLKQIGVSIPVNQPVLDHIDLIGGAVTGIVAPGSAGYTVNTNPSTAILATFGPGTWAATGTTRTITYVIHNVQNSQYVRARGTNLPVNTPNETDAQGNPLSDPINTSAVIPCSDAACPPHMTNGKSTFDVAAWSDLWFYANPIFIRVQTDAPFKVENEAKKAQALRVAKSN